MFQLIVEALQGGDDLEAFPFQAWEDFGVELNRVSLLSGKADDVISFLGLELVVSREDKFVGSVAFPAETPLPRGVVNESCQVNVLAAA